MERELNLIPGEVLEKEAMQGTVLRWGGALMAALIGLATSYALIHLWNASLSQTMARYLKERTVLQSKAQVMVNRISVLQSEKEALVNIEQAVARLSHPQGAGSILDEINLGLPPHVEMTHVEIALPSRIHLQGKALSNSDLADFMNRVQRSQHFSGIELRYSRGEHDMDRSYVVFEMQKDDRPTSQK